MSKYDKIINLPHYELKNHTRMSIENRSAQFAPFSALTGYSDEVKETARLTNKEILMSEDMKSIMDMKLQIVDSHIKEKPEITILYFIKDKKKSGGEYVEYTGNIKRIDTINQAMDFTDGLKINLKDILDINAEFIKE